MPGSKKWPWTPQWGAVAGQTFYSNRQYRAALAVATQGRAEVKDALRKLNWALFDVKDPESRLQAAIEAQAELARNTVWIKYMA
jgi:hypothetical protein